MDLNRSMNAVNRTDRLRIYHEFVAAMADSHPLPSLSVLGSEVPKPILQSVDRLYMAMSAVDYRRRLSDYDVIFAKINRMLLILGHDLAISRFFDPQLRPIWLRRWPVIQKHDAASIEERKIAVWNAIMDRVPAQYLAGIGVSRNCSGFLSWHASAPTYGGFTKQTGERCIFLVPPRESETGRTERFSFDHFPFGSHKGEPRYPGIRIDK